MNSTEEYILQRLESEIESQPDHQHEIVQHLVELGYLPLFQASINNRAELEKAKQQFTIEFEHSPWYNDFIHRQNIDIPPEEFLQEALQLITSIDEGVTLSELPITGELSLTSRIIHYRLDLFGLWTFTTGIPFSSTSIIQLSQAAMLLKSDLTGAFNLMADTHRLTAYLLANYPKEKFILFLRSDSIQPKLQEEFKRVVLFTQQLENDLGKNNQTFEFLRKAVLNRQESQIDYSFLSRETNDEFKQFVIRLIQVHQWQDGFYQGLLDSDLGNISLNSIINAMSIFNQTDEKEVKDHRLFLFLHRGYFVFNALCLLQHYRADETEQIQLNESRQLLINRLHRQYTNSPDDEQNQFARNLDELNKESKSTGSNGQIERNGLIQRIYYGIKRILKKALRFAKHLFRWIARKSKTAWNFVKQLFRGLTAHLKKACMAFIDGYRFLLNKKGISTFENGKLLISVFKKEGDVVTICNTTDTSLIEAHNHKILHSVRSMAFALTLTGGVLKIILNSINMVSWPFLILTILMMYQQVAAAYQLI